MTINASLPISSLINVSASLSVAATQAQSTQTMLILVNDPTIDVVTRIQAFTSATAVAQQTGSNSAATAAVTPWFAQNPQPTQVLLGRWAQTASSGQLFGAPLTAAQQLISTWQAVTAGGMTVTIDGGSAEVITGLNFSAVNNLNGVAAAINAHLTGAVMAWNPLNQNFVITSNSTGTTSTVSFVTAATGTDISGMLGMRSSSSGAYEANGIAAETALAAWTIMDTLYGGQFYGAATVGAADADHVAVAEFLAASANAHYYFGSTQEGGVLVATSTTDLAYLMSSASVSKAAVQYNGSSPYSALSMAARILTVDYTGTNTASNLMYKQEPGITADDLNAAQLTNAIAKNCNVYVSYSNGASIIQPGIGSNGQWIDTQIGADALKLAIQTAVFNLLYTSTTKVGQDDAGMHMVKVTIEQVLAQFVANGYIATGLTWNSAGFGTLNFGDTLSAGYYVYAPALATQPETQRSGRISVPIQIAAKLKGAVQTVDVAIVLNN
jgi:hypothetical protein